MISDRKQVNDRLDKIISKYEISSNLSIPEKAVLAKLLCKNDPEVEIRDKNWVNRNLVDYCKDWRFGDWERSNG